MTLALLVLVIHRFWPGLSILAVIALVAPLLALLFMPQAGRGAALKRQVVERFPAIGGQLVLFLGPGLLAAGINSALSVLDFGSGHGLPLFNHFGWLEACLTLLLIFLVAIVGVHPLISISGWRRCSGRWHRIPACLACASSWGGAGDRDEPALRLQSGAGVPLQPERRAAAALEPALRPVDVRRGLSDDGGFIALHG